MSCVGSIVKELLKAKLLDLGEVRVARASPNAVRGKPRFLIYLPVNRNYVWQWLHESGARIRLFAELPEDLAKKLEATQP